jgi:hypothetical protein
MISPHSVAGVQYSDLRCLLAVFFHRCQDKQFDTLPQGLQIVSCYRGLSREGKRALVFGATLGCFFGFAAVALFGPTAASSDGVKVKP